jgi:hypothetical protein
MSDNQPHPPEPQVSAFEATIRERADRHGLSPAEMLSRDRTLFSTPDPSDCCLDPYEVDQLFSGHLPAHRAAHLDECSLCAAMIEVARPREQWFDEFVRSKAAQDAMSRRAAPQRSAWRPTLQALAFIGGTLVFAAGGLVWYLARSNDALLSNLIKDAAPRSAALLVLIAALALAVAAVGGWWPSKPLRLQTTFGLGRDRLGIAVGGLFSFIVCGYIGYAGLRVAENYGNVQAAQYALLGRIAFAELHGENFADSLYAEKLKSLPGSLVAQRFDDNFHISWDKPAGLIRNRKLNFLGTIYQGPLRTESDGDTVMHAGNKEIDVAPTALSTGIRYRNNISALALVPAKTGSASTVFPLYTAGKLDEPTHMTLTPP